MKLPTSMTANVNIVSMWSEATNAKPSHFQCPRSIRPGLNAPVIVVYRRLDRIHRWNGMMTAMTISVMLASAVADP